MGFQTHAFAREINIESRRLATPPLLRPPKVTAQFKLPGQNQQISFSSHIHFVHISFGVRIEIENAQSACLSISIDIHQQSGATAVAATKAALVL